MSAGPFGWKVDDGRRGSTGSGVPSASAEAPAPGPGRGETHLVSVIVPCRNESASIADFLASVRAQQLPPGWRMEVVIADGASDDGTRDRLAALSTTGIHAHDRAAGTPPLAAPIMVIDNPARIVSTGLNRALGASRGEVVVRMDVHTAYAPDYVAACLAALRESGADNVGGPWRAATDGATTTERAIAAVFQSRWLAGGARSRQLDYDGPADTVYLGCWPRASFERWGGFDEQLVRNQDDEHNLRILRGGGRLWQSAAIRSSYRPRGSIGQLFRQQFQYGYWKPYVMKKHGQPAALRHLLPAGFVLLLALLLLAWAAGAPAAWPLALAGLYATAVAAASVLIAGRAGPALLPRLPLVIAAYHLGYGLGSLLGWVDVLRGVPGRRTGLTR